jgi:hypothetical protein
MFIFGVNADQTCEKYITRMKKFLEIASIDPEKNYPCKRDSASSQRTGA